MMKVKVKMIDIMLIVGSIILVIFWFIYLIKLAIDRHKKIVESADNLMFEQQSDDTVIINDDYSNYNDYVNDDNSNDNNNNDVNDDYSNDNK